MAAVLKDGLFSMQGQTAIHLAASENIRKGKDRGNAARYQELQSEENIPEWQFVRKSFTDYAHVYLLYEQIVSTLVAHAGLRMLYEQDDQVWTSTHPHFADATPRVVLD